MGHALILDVQNLIHRARSGFTKGEHPIVFNFLRGLRPIFEKFKPDAAFFVLEGVPRRRLEVYPEYKATRKKMEPSAYEAFIRQVDECVDCLIHSFPGSIVIHHPDYEADDVIAYSTSLCAKTLGQTVTIVSSDTDFIQLLQKGWDVRLWNPIKKAFIEAPDYDYISWKALCGDGSDNIIGVSGVGDKTAKALLGDTQQLEKTLCKGDTRELFARNKDLIEFDMVDDRELRFLNEGHDRTWDELHNRLELFDFKSMLKETTWEKYKATFATLKGITS